MPGAEVMALLVGTDKGLFRLVEDTATGQWVTDGPHMPGLSVLHTMLASDTTLYAATSHKVWGAHLYLSLIHISEPTRPRLVSRMPSSA